MSDAGTASPGPEPRRPLELDDLRQLDEALRAAGDPPAVFAATEALVGGVIGQRLFTINLFDAPRFEVARVHTSRPTIYPVGGRKQKARTSWGDHVLVGMQVFLAPDAAAVRAAFDDYETLFDLGIGAILNIPVVCNGRCVGTMNLCHAAHWFTPEDARKAQLIAAFLVAPLLALQDQATDP
jgi:GAF domain-containing protein